MTRFLVIKNFVQLNKSLKKNSEQNKTQNPSSLNLFTFVVLLFIDVSVDIIIIFIHCSKKWLLSYVPSCHENLEIRFTTSPLNGIIIGLPTRSLYTNMELEPLLFVSWMPQIAFFFWSMFVYVCQLFSFSFCAQ